MNLTHFRTILSRLRLSSHRLCIETGRWNKPISTPLIDRKCTVCNTLEDEYHFVMECRLHTDIRRQFLPNYLWRRPNMYKFVELINTEHSHVIKSLGKFIYTAFSIRSSALYNNQI